MESWFILRNIKISLLLNKQNLSNLDTMNNTIKSRGQSVHAAEHPRPMNLERRFNEKHTMNSPSKYRWASCKTTTINSVGKNFIKTATSLSPTKMEKTTKKYLLETLRLMSKNRLKDAKNVIEQVLAQGYDHSDAYFL